MARPPSVCVGVCQMSMSASAPANLAKAEALVRRAAAQGAGVVLLPELFETRYFPKSQASENLMMAKEVQDSPVLERFQRLSEELGIVLPVSFYEKAGTHDDPFGGARRLGTGTSAWSMAFASVPLSSSTSMPPFQHPVASPSLWCAA